ncbi:MAG: hypothetical protein CME72_12635 [Halomonadaceae bacterium]|nr:hypothetical protein [Halomonadaceae bacterium]
MAVRHRVVAGFSYSLLRLDPFQQRLGGVLATKNLGEDERSELISAGLGFLDLLIDLLLARSAKAKS